MAEPLFSYQEVERILESILNNKKLVRVDSKEDSIFIIFRHPTSDEILISRYMRDKAVDEARAMGLPSREDMERLIEERGVLNSEDREKIEEFQEKVRGQKRVLQLTKIEGRRKPILENIERYEKEIEEIKNKSESLLLMSAESKADEESIFYLAWNSTYNINGDKYWKTFQDFEDDTDHVLRNSIISEYLKFNQGYDIKTIRYLARHNLWRLRFTAATKLGGSLFCRQLYDLTPDQLGLLYWSQYYQSIYEMLPDDQPDQETINDDDALDSYMEAYAKRREQEKNEGRIKRRGGKGKKLSAWERGEEIIITSNHPEYMNMQYSEHRVKPENEKVSDVEVIAPNSRRARNRAQSRRSSSRGGAGTL